MLRGRLLIGRSPSSDLRLEASGVSGEHAAIHWTGAEWRIRDLGSRNGTRVNQKLLLGKDLRLAPDDQIIFGDPREAWTWSDGAAPLPAAVRADGVEVEGTATMLLLPDDQEPAAAVLARGESWLLEQPGATRKVFDQEAVEVNGEQFRLLLPALDPLAARTQTIAPVHRILQARLRFRVSLDEEHVRVTVESQGTTREISQRAYHYMLLVLARQRLADQQQGVPEEDSGWVYGDELARKLGVEMNTLHVHVHRARRLVEAPREGASSVLSFSDAHELIQRRGGQLRLGVADVVIDR